MPVAAGGDILGFFVHEVIRIAAGGLGKLLFILAERVAVPAHDHAGLKGEGFILPDAGDAVAVDADAAMLVGLGLVGVILILPEAAAEDSRPGWRPPRRRPRSPAARRRRPATTACLRPDRFRPRLLRPPWRRRCRTRKSSGRYPSSGRWEAAILSSQSRAFRSKMPVVQALDGSEENTPVIL